MHLRYVVLSVLLIVVSQRTRAESSSTQPFRFENPVAITVGIQGFGIDLCIGNRFAFNVSTWFVYHMANGRVYLANSNSSAFVGAGVGLASSGINMRDYVAINGGWEYSKRHFVVQLLIGYILTQNNTRLPIPIFPGLNIGYRF